MRRSLIHFISILGMPKRHRPYSLQAAPGRPVVWSRLPREGSGAPGNAGACEAPWSGWRSRPTRLARRDLSARAESRLSALHLRRFPFPGPRFLVPARFAFGPPRQFGSSPCRALVLRQPLAAPVQQSSLRRGPSAPRSGPGTSRERGYEPRPRAPHRPAKARLKRASCRPEPPRLPHLRQPPSAAPSSARLRKTPLEERDGVCILSYRIVVKGR